MCPIRPDCNRISIVENENNVGTCQTQFGPAAERYVPLPKSCPTFVFSFFSYIPLPQGPILAVSLDVSHKGLGITIAGGIGNEHIPGDHSIFITSVFPNGSAYSLLEAGMKVIEIDGANVENELHEKVVEKLNNAGARINLLVGCPARNSSGVGNFYHVIQY